MVLEHHQKEQTDMRQCIKPEIETESGNVIEILA
jgi:hypothetical protein